MTGSINQLLYLYIDIEPAPLTQYCVSLLSQDQFGIATQIISILAFEKVSMKNGEEAGDKRVVSANSTPSFYEPIIRVDPRRRQVEAVYCTNRRRNPVA